MGNAVAGGRRGWPGVQAIAPVAPD